MSDELDLAALAQYLHLSPDQVSRLVERGNLPARRVGGQWRFSLPAVHGWLESRMGASDDAELARMEGFLTDEPVAPAEEWSLAELLPPEAIELELAARTRTSVIEQMVELAVRTGWLWDPDRLGDAVRQREALHPTALDNGVALLHPRRPMPQILERPFLALGRTNAGVPFAGSRKLTDVFFLICSADDRQHLRSLARLSRLLNEEDFLPALRAAPDALTVLEAVRQFERIVAER